MITIVGGGDIRDTKGMSVRGLEIIQNSEKVVFQSSKQAVFGLCENPLSLDEIYENSEDFDDFIDDACDYIEDMEDVVFVAIGDGLRNNICTELCKRNKDIKVVSGASPVTLEVAHGAGLFTNDALTYVNGHDFKYPNTNINTYVYEIDNEMLFYDIKSKLLDFYPMETKIAINETVTTLCDCEPVIPCDIFLPKVKLLDKPVFLYDDLMTIIKDLRKKCPWDREQTHESIRINLLEEACEMLEAIDKEDVNELIEEMGDVLLQVCFHNLMEMEHGDVEFYDITTEVCKKLIRRHPHVYGTLGAKDSEKALDNWDSIKTVEYELKGIRDELEHVSGMLPGVMRANKVLKKADKNGVVLNGDILEILDKVKNGEDVDNNGARLMLLVIDMLRKIKVNPYMSIHDATESFIDIADEITSKADSKDEIKAIDVKDIKID